MNESLEERVRSPGFTPRRRDTDALFALLSSADDDLAKDVERALSRLGPVIASAAVERFERSTPPLRSRLCALVGRLAAAAHDGQLVDFLALRLEDPDPKTRRRAIRSLGKIDDPCVEERLLSAFRDDVPAPDARALAAALGNVGSERALSRLKHIGSSDPELARIVRESKMKLERASVRRTPGVIDASRSPGRPLPVLLHVRAGLEEILLDELGDRAGARIAGRGRVELVLDGPLDAVFRARTFLHLGFPLPPEPAREGEATEAAVRALTSDAAMGVFQTFTRGPIRYRIDWSTGRRRGATFQLSAMVAAARPELVNDPTAAPWEVVVTDRSGGDRGRVYVELWPRALVDPRFSYRHRTLPASSHPTVAAALARVGGATPFDIVWDPFVGAGGELVERALLGPYVRLYGTDVDSSALAAARENLAAAQVRDFELIAGDARTVRLPESPTLVLTNPPFGKRVLEPGLVKPLLEATLDRASKLLRPGGRFVWMSPVAETTANAARRSGFSVRLRRAVDVGGARAELQAFVLAERHRP